MLILFIFHRWLARIALITRMFNFWNQDQIILKQALLTRTKLMYICFLVLRIGFRAKNRVIQCFPSGRWSPWRARSLWPKTLICACVTPRPRASWVSTQLVNRFSITVGSLCKWLAALWYDRVAVLRLRRVDLGIPTRAMPSAQTCHLRSLQARTWHHTLYTQASWFE